MGNDLLLQCPTLPLIDVISNSADVYPVMLKDPADAGYGQLHLSSNEYGKVRPCTRKKRKTRNTIPIRLPINFRVDENGTIRCPNDRAFKFIYDIWSDIYGRQEEVFMTLSNVKAKNKRISLSRERNNIRFRIIWKASMETECFNPG